MNLNNYKFWSIYFFIILLVSLIAMYTIPQPYKISIPSIILLHSPLFFFNSLFKNFDFNNELKKRYPDIHEKNNFDLNSHNIKEELACILNYFDNSDFNQLDKNLIKESKLVKTFFVLSWLFLSIGTLLMILSLN